MQDALSRAFWVGQRAHPAVRLEVDWHTQTGRVQCSSVGSEWSLVGDVKRCRGERQALHFGVGRTLVWRYFMEGWLAR